jgi:hypothetical protein
LRLPFRHSAEETSFPLKPEFCYPQQASGPKAVPSAQATL